MIKSCRFKKYLRLLLQLIQILYKMKTKFNGILTLLLAFVVQISFAQEKTVSGTVSDESGRLPQVSVLIKGTTKGTGTDFDGKYSIRAKAGDVLVFSYLGYKTVERTVGAPNTINVTLKGSEILDEIIVTALGIKRKAKSIGYAQQTVKGDNLTKTRETDISTALAGKIAGIQFTGQPSSSFKNSDIRLRGSKHVLYIVDGIKLNSSTDVNTDEISSITVLKGLAATALYGPDGINGAIVITTKKAKNGETKIIFNNSLSLSSVYSMKDYQNEYGGGYANDGKPKGHADRYRSAIGKFKPFVFNAANHPASWNSFNGHLLPTYSADESWGPRLEGQMVRHWDSWIPGDPEFGKLRAWKANPNNIKDFYRAGRTLNNSIAFSKGGEDYSIRSTITHIDKTLILENSKRTTTSFSINADYSISSKLKFNTNFNYTDRFTKNDPDSSYGNLGANFNQWWQRQIDINRLREYKRNGQAVSWNIRSPTNIRPAYWNSPFFILYENIKNQQKNGLYGQVGLTYEFNDNFNAQIAYKKAYNQYEYNKRSGWGGLEQEKYRESLSVTSRDEIYGITNYNKTFNDFNINASVGFETSKERFKSLYTSTVGGMTTPGFYSIATSKDRPNTKSLEIKRESKAWFTTASVGYKEMLFTELTYRKDYGSTAKKGDNSVTTKGITGSFIFSEILPENDILTFAKVRIGYAEAPYFPVPYQLSQTYAPGKPYGSNGTSTVPNVGVNPDLKGGRKEELEYGLEFRFLQNRLSLDLTYFDRTDSNLPSFVTVPGSSGITGYYSNQGKQTAKGFEASLSGTLIKTDDFTWNVVINAATLKRKVVYIADGVDVNILSSWGPQLQERKGEEWGAIYGNTYKRDDNGNKVLNSNGLYERESNKYLGSILPDVTGGFSTSFSYKNFDLSLGFDYQFGGKFYGVSRRYGNYAGLSTETVGNNVLGNPVRGTIAGSGTHKAYSINLANADATSGGQLTSGVDSSGNPQQFLVNPHVLWRNNLRNIHEEYINDATYIKLRTIRMGYNLPSKIVKKLHFTDINIAVFADNVWLIKSDLKGIDPSELEGRNAGNRIIGLNNYEWIENGQLPSVRTIGINAKFTF